MTHNYINIINEKCKRPIHLSYCTFFVLYFCFWLVLLLNFNPGYNILHFFCPGIHLNFALLIKPESENIHYGAAALDYGLLSVSAGTKCAGLD